MNCECYPPERYPAQMAKGCTGMSNCHVIADMRERATPEGIERQQAAYRLECRLALGGEGGERRVDVRHRLSRLGVPGVALAAIGEAAATDSLRAARKWWASDKRLVPALVLLGDVGQGKTVASAWCASEWAAHHPWNDQPSGGPARTPFVWLDGPRLRELSAWGDSAHELLAQARSAELCVVDDAGREGDARAMSALSDVLMERVDNGRATVLTSNLKGDAFRGRYGIALADRLRACAMVPTLSGKSLRTAKASTALWAKQDGGR